MSEETVIIKKANLKRLQNRIAELEAEVEELKASGIPELIDEGVLEAKDAEIAQLKAANLALEERLNKVRACLEETE